jgi:shikimate dehydrogenase
MPETYDRLSKKALMHGPLESLYCCIGDPVVGNPTQLMIEAAFRAMHHPGRYLTCTVNSNNLRESIQGIRALGFAGANVTAPHKVAVMEYLDSITESASLSAAVNCISNKNGKLVGDNTDGKGFLQSIQEIARIEGMRVLVFGAGGASRAIVTELALHGATEIVLVNRTQSKALEIAESLDKHVSTRIVATEWKKGFVIGKEFDLVVQATSVGLFDPQGALDVIWQTGSHSSQIAADVVFNPIHTQFIESAQKVDARTVDGLGMLVNQGAIAISQWTGSNANLGVMHAALTDAFLI